MDIPVLVIPQTITEINVTIIAAPSSNGNENEEGESPVDLMDKNRMVMPFLYPKCPMEEVNNFQQQYANMTVGRQMLLQTYIGAKPDYH